MKCLDPKLCYTTKTGKKLRHFSLANPAFKLLANQVFNCGTCIFCRKKRSYELAVRCVLHASLHLHNAFITLTYDETKEGYSNELLYKHIQDFKKRLRRYVQYHFKKNIQIFNVHEYGKKGKKHWHLILFNYDFSEIPKGKDSSYLRRNHPSDGTNPLYRSKILEDLWPFGFSTIGDVSEASAMYQSQYTQKDIKNGNTANSKKAKSNHSGIGKEYFLRHYKQILRLGYIPFGGRKIPIPRYFQKIAHKHYSHFYEQDNFFHLPYRKRLYTPFKQGLENKEIADLYIDFVKQKNIKIKTLEEEWEKTIEAYIYNNEKPDFMISAENYLYDLKNKITDEKF